MSKDINEATAVVLGIFQRQSDGLAFAEVEDDSHPQGTRMVPVLDADGNNVPLSTIEARQRAGETVTYTIDGSLANIYPTQEPS